MTGGSGQGPCWSWVRRGGGGRGGGEGGEEGRRLDERRQASLMKQASLSAGQSRSLDCLEVHNTQFQLSSKDSVYQPVSDQELQTWPRHCGTMSSLFHL